MSCIASNLPVGVIVTWVTTECWEFVALFETGTVWNKLKSTLKYLPWKKVWQFPMEAVCILIYTAAGIAQLQSS